MKPGVAACKRYFNKNREAVNARRRVRRDSTELAHLRADYCMLGFKRPCTAIRLGAFTALEGYTVKDFGSHSKRWIRQFNEGTALRAGLFIKEARKR